ncbi:MAG: aromatic-ring-hydroxylating dioxygenase subunit beta [Burkholderiales bacterium]
MSGAPSERELAELVYREARLLDERRYDDWFALLAGDARYWVPLAASETDPAGQSIAYEDRLLLEIRIRRLASPKAYSMHPPPASRHVLQAPAVETLDHAANRYVTQTPFVYVEARGDDQITLAGTVRHEMRVENGALRIALKRVDLLNAGAALPTIYLFL